MNEQLGAVIVFKQDVSKEEAEEALKKIQHLLDLDYYLNKEIRINSFNPAWGGPVWYVP